MALIILGGYCSRVALRCCHVQSLGTSSHNNRISNSPPHGEKMVCPHAKFGLRWAKKEGWLIPVTYISVVLGTWVPRVSVNDQLIPFPAPLVESCSKVSLGRSRSSCRDISEQGSQTSLVRELVTGDPMACSILGHPRKHPSGTIAHRQCWQLLPGLEHGCVESINQLVWYHTQINTPTEWCH